MTIRIYELCVLCVILCGKKIQGPRKTQRKIQHKVRQDMIGLLHTDSHLELFFQVKATQIFKMPVPFYFFFQLFHPGQHRYNFG